MAQTGTVKFFNDKEGFGFITSDDGDVFVHASNIVGDVVLSEGQSVELEILGDVVGGKTHRSGASGDGDGTLTVDVFDRPVVPDLHHHPAVGAQGCAGCGG